METQTTRTGFSDSVKRRTLVVTVLGAGIVFLDSSIANVALPAIQRDLGLSTAMQQWVASSYLLTLSVLLLAGGRLSDIFGRKRLFTLGLSGYIVLAVAAGFAPSGIVLVLVRALQGVAGALLVPTTLAIVNAVFEPGERGKAIGTWSAWSGISTVLGPVIGGYVIDNLTWRYAFFITPVLALVTLALLRPVPETRDEGASRAIDWLGTFLVVSALGGLVLALIQGPISGWDARAVRGGFVTAIVMLPAFLWWERKAAHPLMPFELFSNRNLAVANGVTLFVYAGLYGTSFYSTLYVQSALGASATLAGAIFIPITILLFFLSPYAGRLNDRYGPRWLMCFGPWVSAVGVVVMGYTGPGQLWTVLLPGIILFGIGLGFTVAPVTATAIGSADERFSGVASGFNNGVSRIAGLLAIAVTGVLVVQLWQAGIQTAGVGADPRVSAALGSVSDQAFVIPDTAGLDAATAAEVEALAVRAAEDGFRSGTLVTGGLLVLGGLVSAIWIEDRRDRTSA